MAALSELSGDLVTDVDGLFLFVPSNSYYEQFTEMDVPMVVIASENTVKVETFVELPLQFQDIKDRIHFGVKGAMEQGIVEVDDIITCNVGTFGGDSDSLIRVRAEENIRSGIYGLFTDSRADPGIIRDVFETAVELGREGQRGGPVSALSIVDDAGKVMNKSRPLLYNPFEKSHVYVGDPIINVMFKESSRLDDAFVISDSGKIVSAYRCLEPSAEDVDAPKGLGVRHMAGGAITRDTNITAIVLSESDGLVRAFKGGRMALEIDLKAH